MDNIKPIKEKYKLEKAIKDNGYTMQTFSEEVIGITRNNLYRKINKGVKFTKLEKEKIEEVLNIKIG